MITKTTPASNPAGMAGPGLRIGRLAGASLALVPWFIGVTAALAQPHPAAKTSPAAAARGTAPAPARVNAPPVAKEAAAAPANKADTAGGFVTVQLPASNVQDLVWITQGDFTGEQTLVSGGTAAKIACPAAGAVTIHVMDPSSNQVAVVDGVVGGTSRVAIESFTTAARVVVQLQDKDKNPLDYATVTLSSGQWSQTEQLSPMDGGSLSFLYVPLGKLTATAVRNGLKSEAEADLNSDSLKSSSSGMNAAAGPVSLLITINQASTLPVAYTAAEADHPEAGSISGKAQSTAGSTAAESDSAKGSAAARHTGQKTTTGGSPPPPSSNRGLYLVALLLLAGLVVGAIWAARNSERVWSMAAPWLHKLGIDMPATGPVAGSGLTPGRGEDAAITDSSTCPFCGTHKDPVTGSCACTLVPAGVTGVPNSAIPSIAELSSGPLSGPRLVTIDGPSQGKVFDLAREHSIGRDTTNTISLAADSAVSRHHARVWANDGQVEIVDKGSSNGTFVNGARIERQILQPTDEIQIGRSRFRFEA